MQRMKMTAGVVALVTLFGLAGCNQRPADTAEGDQPMGSTGGGAGGAPTSPSGDSSGSAPSAAPSDDMGGSSGGTMGSPDSR